MLKTAVLFRFRASLVALKRSHDQVDLKSHWHWIQKCSSRNALKNSNNKKERASPIRKSCWINFFNIQLHGEIVIRKRNTKFARMNFPVSETLLTSLNKIPSLRRSPGFVAASMLEAHSLQTEAGVNMMKGKANVCFETLSRINQKLLHWWTQKKRFIRNITAIICEGSRFFVWSILFGLCAVFKVRGCTSLSKQILTFEPDHPIGQ